MRAQAKRNITLLVLIGFAMLVISADYTPNLASDMLLRPKANATFAYTPHAAIHIDGNADFIAQATAESWPGNGSATAPYLITGYYFYDVTHSMEVWNVDLHWAFTNNEVDGPYDGTVWCSIELDNCSNAEVSNNVFHHRFRGIWFVDISNVVIANNTVIDNLSQGIEIVGSAQNVVIEDNYIENCDGVGIRVQGGIDCEITDNVIKNVGLSGIQLLTSASNCVVANNHMENLGSMGIIAAPSTSVTIMHNQAINFTGDGIYMQSSSACEIYNNTLTNGGDNGMTFKNLTESSVRNNTLTTFDEIGIELEAGNSSDFMYNLIESSSEYGFVASADTGGNTIAQNGFVDNGGTSSQVSDSGAGNSFTYNYYNEWTSPDADSDLIVDVPYSIDGTANNEDPTPLAQPNVVPPTTTTSTTGGTQSVPMEILLVAGGAVVVILVGAFVLRRR